MITRVFPFIKQALHFTPAMVALGWVVVAGAANAAPLLADTIHTDGRGTPKLVFPPPGNVPVANGRLEADHFLTTRQAEFKLPADMANLELVSTRASLLGTHYRYRQLLNGLPVEGADLVVSISRDTGEVYQAYNNTWPVAAPPALPKALIGDDGALDAAWNHLRVHGKLLTGLRSQLVYLPENGGFRLIYKTLVATEAPFGYWEHLIDATAGDVVAVRDTVVHLNKQREPVPDFNAYDGPVLSRTDAVRKWAMASAARKQIPAVQKTTVDGTAQVFDGDPRTTLADASLRDSNPASAFTPAYVTRTLRDISLSGGLYSLEGPWVRIVDFEPPNTAPSTTPTGDWTALRGNNAFNDAMTYFHLDQNQRYLQSLGYTGATGIQYGPIQADSDGDNGADNSYYSPADNQLAFGHGGVDDNEDPDVILHEYGHAITYDIISSWGGGDTGAIGEGFGDYWGASFSSTTTNGTTFHPEWAFSWDGHSADTWPGRFLDKTTLTYDPSHTYVAHETISGIDNYSDQLWGTPLFQAFLTLRGLGYPRVDMDKIIIESFFGVGGNPTMRDMATATVNAATLLFPSGPHASTFFTKFAAQNILTKDPTVFAAASVGATQIDLSWVKNLANDNVMVAWNTTNTFGTPAGTYIAGGTISGGGTVLYNGSDTSVSHTGLIAGATYYYKAWSVLAGPTYSTGVTCSACAGESLVFAEGFENGGSIPTGWTQSYVTSPSLNWTFRDGSEGGLPSSARGGSYNACLFDETSADNATKLVTPAINFGTSILNTKLTFWHYMADWDGDQDQLKVYYRTSAGGTWTSLATYTASVGTWTQQTISLPNPGSTYYLAFEGNAKYGYGVCIDDVRVVGSVTFVAWPVITWPAPKAITYGKPLSSTQFKVKANVAGSFVFAPAIGTILPAGTHTLTATFTPTDTVHYATVQKSVPLIVNKAAAKVTIAGLKQTYNGLPRPVTATTRPAGLNVIITYAGAVDAPVNVGSYAVLAVVDDPNATGSKTGKLVIAQGQQTITFPLLPTLNVGDADYDLSAIASSGLPVSYASSAPTVATIVDGKLHILTAGSVTITASQPGDANWHAASSVKHALTIGPALIIPTQSYHTGVSPGDAISQTLPVRVEDPAIRTFYAEMKRLVEVHDVPGFLALFAPDYFHAGHDLTGQLDGGPDMFDAVRTFTFDITGISVTASDAMVAGTATFAFDAGDATETWTEADMTNHSPGIGWLRKTPTGWRVIGDQKRARVSVATTHGTTPDDERNALLLRTESSLEITGASVSGLGIATTELQPDPETGGWRAEIGNFTSDDRPPVGTVYTFVIGFTDGSQATYQDSVKAWVAAGPIVSVTTDAGSAVIHWTAVNAAVANAESYGVRVSGPGLDWESDPLPLTQSSAVFNDNGHAQGGTLQSGQHYVAEVFILNQSGDSASQRIEFSMP